MLLKCLRNRKFDLRVWVLVVGSRPMRVYYFEQFYGRVSAKEYSEEVGSLNDPAVHLTNYALHKDHYAMEKSVSSSILLP